MYLLNTILFSAILFLTTTDSEPTPSKGKIVFMSEIEENMDIWVIDANGNNLTRLTTHTKDDRYPALSPDGRKIAFMSKRTGFNDIWIMNHDGSNKIQITADPAGYDWYPAWSPDGKKIAFSRRRGNWDIWVMNADGSNQTQLTTDWHDDRCPTWSPNGTKIAFESARAGHNWEIWVMDSDGSNQTPLTTGGFQEKLADWSPDGNKIAFTSSRSGNDDIWVMDADGSNQSQLTTNSASDKFPTWSPDGNKIAFTSSRSGNNDIWIMDHNGDNKEQLTINTSLDDESDWGISSPLLPDLIVEDISFDTPSPVRNGTTVLINTTIQNIGGLEATNVTIKFYDGDPGNPFGSGPGFQIGTDHIAPSILIGENITVQITWNASPLGLHNIYVIADPFDIIMEYNETNNVANRSIGVGVLLHEGWNLISIPLIQSDTDIGAVLSSIFGSFNAVQWFNLTDLGDQWKHNHIEKPSHMNDFTEINHTMGFWIHITKPGGAIFVYNGTRSSQNQSISLHVGWNLVGYPSLSHYNLTMGLNNLEFSTDVDCIQWFDADTKIWHFMDQNDNFIPGRGYWIHSKVTKIWDVPW
jgi:Tol biopolymer transport system component